MRSVGSFRRLRAKVSTKQTPTVINKMYHRPDTAAGRKRTQQAEGVVLVLPHVTGRCEHEAHHGVHGD
jgi:hypothetical protein